MTVLTLPFIDVLVLEETPTQPSGLSGSSLSQELLPWLPPYPFPIPDPDSNPLPVVG